MPALFDIARPAATPEQGELITVLGAPVADLVEQTPTATPAPAAQDCANCGGIGHLFGGPGRRIWPAGYDEMRTVCTWCRGTGKGTRAADAIEALRPAAYELTIDGDATPFAPAPTRVRAVAPAPTATRTPEPLPIATAAPQYPGEVPMIDAVGTVALCRCGHARDMHRRINLAAPRTWHECTACPCLTHTL